MRLNNMIHEPFAWFWTKKTLNQLDEPIISVCENVKRDTSVFSGHRASRGCHLLEQSFESSTDGEPDQIKQVRLQKNIGETQTRSSR